MAGILMFWFCFCCFFFFFFLGHTDRQQEREPGLLGHMWFHSRAGGGFGGGARALTVKTSCPGFPLEKKRTCEKKESGQNTRKSALKGQTCEIQQA